MWGIIIALLPWVSAEEAFRWRPGGEGVSGKPDHSSWGSLGGQGGQGHLCSCFRPEGPQVFSEMGTWLYPGRPLRSLSWAGEGVQAQDKVRAGGTMVSCSILGHRGPARHPTGESPPSPASGVVGSRDGGTEQEAQPGRVPPPGSGRGRRGPCLGRGGCRLPSELVSSSEALRSSLQRAAGPDGHSSSPRAS